MSKEGVHHSKRKEREVHEQTATGGCECSDRFNKGTAMMMMTFITQRGESQGKTKKERKATKSKGRGLEP